MEQKNESGLDARQVARLQAENDTLAFECDLLRREIDRLTALNRMLQGKIALHDGECERQKTLLTAIQNSRPWRITQALRGLVGRRW